MMIIVYPNLEKEEINQDYINKFDKLILYFYPKDLTSGCTKEANDFNFHIDIFKKNGYEVIGVSKDNPLLHQKFITKYNLKFSLISDIDLILHKKFNVLGEKNMYGKKYLGTIRSTFVLRKGEILKEYRNVKSTGHVDQLIKELGLN